MTRRLRIRSVLTRMMLGIAALALVAAVAFAVLTRQLQRIGDTTSAAVESVRLGNEVQIDLLLYERVQDSLVRRDVEADLRQRLAEVDQHVETIDERALLDRSVTSVDAYLRALQAGADDGHARDLHDAAYGALRAFIDANVLASRDAREMAARWDAVADLLAVLLALAVLATGAWLVWWVRTRAIQPLLGLADTVERFGRGEKDLRADERGPLEISEMARRFNRMAETLATQRSAQLAHLAAVAHDLRNPVWALQLALSTARAGEGQDGSRARRGLEAADKQVARLTRMIEDLLDASNIEAGQLELRCGLHDLGELARELAEQAGAMSKKHRIECRVPMEPLTAVVDPLRIGQVLTNLLTNAIKYSPAGGTIELELRREDERAVVLVRDTGLGIDESDVADIFEPFRRLESGKRAGAGTGLGLFVVRRIVEAHGGTIAVDSARGHGSTFRVELPLVQPPSAGTNVASPRPSSAAPG